MIRAHVRKLVINLVHPVGIEQRWCGCTIRQRKILSRGPYSVEVFSALEVKRFVGTKAAPSIYRGPDLIVKSAKRRRGIAVVAD